MTKFKAIVILLIVASIGITAGIILYEKSKKYDVSIGYLTGDIHHLPFFIAEYKGFFKDEGLNVTSYQFQNGNLVMNAFESSTRNIDMAYLGFAPAVVHRITNENANIKVVASVNVNGSSIVVKNNGSINSISDLVGKKIAIPSYNTMQDFILRMTLESENISYDDVTKMEMFVSQMKIALESGSIDGYVAWEPFCALSINNGTGKYLVNSSQIWPDHPCCIVSVHNEFLKQKPEIVKKVLKAHVRAVNFINDPKNYEEVINIAVEKLGLSENVIKMALRNVGYIYTPNLNTMTEFIQKLIDFGVVSLPGSYLPPNINTASNFVNYFVSTTILSEVV